jgi:DNA replication protein DnaC
MNTLSITVSEIPEQTPGNTINVVFSDSLKLYITEQRNVILTSITNFSQLDELVTRSFNHILDHIKNMEDTRYTTIDEYKTKRDDLIWNILCGNGATQ